MRELKDILKEIMAVIKSIEIPVNVSLEFENGLMDVPLRKPSVAVGVREAALDAAAIGFYSGLSSGAEEYSVPSELQVSANIYLPNTFDGSLCYDVLSLMSAALMDSGIGLYKVTVEKMNYDRTFLSICLPVTLHIRTRAFGSV